ncbi:hypothetical protein Bca4012_081658 [Brassica carinata]
MLILKSLTLLIKLAAAVYVLFRDDHTIKLPHCIAIAGLICAVFAIGIPHLSALGVWLAVSTILSLIYIVVAIVISVRDGVKAPARDYEIQGTSLSKLFTITGAAANLVFAFNTGMLPEIQATVRQPVVKNMMKALYFQFTAGVLPMYAVTFIGYWAYGSSTSTYLLNSVNGPLWVKALANISAILQSVISLHIFASPTYEYMDTRFGIKGHPLAIKNLLFRIMARGGYIAVSTLISALLPFLGDFMSLTGAVSTFPLTFILANHMYYKAKNNKLSPVQKLWHWLNVVFFSLMSVAAAVAAERRTPQQESSKVSTKDLLLSLLLPNTSSPHEQDSLASIKSLALACALLSSSRSSTHELLSWIPESLSTAGDSALSEISQDYFRGGSNDDGKKMRVVVELLPVVLPDLKDTIEGSSMGKNGDDADDVSAAMTRQPVACWLCCPSCSPAQVVCDSETGIGEGLQLGGSLCFDSTGPLVSTSQSNSFGTGYDKNIASDDEIWIHVVELSVLLMTKLHPNNPRSSWIMNEMLGHLERQPRNKERCIAWLRFVEPHLNALGLFLLAYFRRIFPLFFQWMHSDDAETVLLVLERVETVVRLTCVRNSPVIPRLVDELVSLYKESSMRKDRDEIIPLILRILKLLRQSKSLQFEHQEDLNLSTVVEYIWTSST